MSKKRESIKQGPLSMEEMRRQAEANNGIVTGAVFVDLKTVIDTDMETFLEILSEKLTGTFLLYGTEFRLMPESCSSDTLCFAVSGDVSWSLGGEGK